MLCPFARSERSLAGDSPRRLLWGLFLAAVLLTGWGSWFLLARVAVYAVSDKADIEVDRAAHPVEAQFSGRVVSSRLGLDQEVRVGEVLVELDSDAQQLQLKEERVHLSTVGPHVTDLERQIASVQAALDRERGSGSVALEESGARVKEADASAGLAEEDAKRLEQLFSSGVVSEADLHRVRATAQERRSAAESLRLAVTRLERQQLIQESERQAQIEELRTRLVQIEGEKSTASASIERLESEVNRRSIRAPVDGRLGEVANLRVGSVVREGDKLAAIIPIGKLRVVATFLPEDALGRVRAGQHARLRLEGFPWAQYGSVSATVTKLANEVRDGHIRVELAVEPNSTSRIPLQHGLPGTIEVRVEEVSPASLVLRAAGRLLASPGTPAPLSKPGGQP